MQGGKDPLHPLTEAWVVAIYQGFASPKCSPVQTRFARLAAACAFALDSSPLGFGNGAGVKGSWNTAGSAATEDMPRKPLDACGMTPASGSGVGEEGSAATA